MFKDHGTGYYGNVFEFVATILNIDYATNKHYVWLEIDEKLGLGIFSEAIPNRPVKFTKTNMSRLLEKASITTVIRVWKADWPTSTTNGFTSAGLAYWQSYGIDNLDTLIRFQVYQIKQSEIHKIMTYSPEDLVFAYNIANRFKLLSVRIKDKPVAKQYKWQNNYESHFIEGWIQIDWESLAQTKLLFLTKALKEVMFFYELGHIAIAGKSESSMIGLNYLVYLAKKIPDITVVVYLDNDKQGISQANKYKELLEKLGITHKILQIPAEYNPAKDPTDVVKYYDKTKFIELLNQQLKNG
jgi:hypothetical protein